MRLALESDPSLNLVRSYDAGSIVIGTQQITRPCLVAPRELLLDWNAISVEELSEAQLEAVFARHPDIVLLGSATGQQWPSAAIRRLCRSKQIALECMNLGAACRTYNILATEDRKVLAGLFP